MKIGVDAGCLGITDKRLQVGVYTVVKNLLIELGKIDKTNEYYLYSFYPIEKSLLQKFGPRMKNIVVTPVRGWLKIALPLRLAKDAVDIFLAANQAVPVKFPFAKYKTVSIFYDIAFEKYPELYSYAASIQKHHGNSLTAAKNADKVIAISQSTKKDLGDIYKISPQKIIVAYPGIGKLPQTKKYKNKNPYFLFVGAFKKSKNIPFLLKSFEEFLRNTKNDYDLLLVGGDKWLDPEIQNTLEKMINNIKNRIKFLGFVDNATLTSLYKGAVAFVSPSLYEGFGLPFIEAQSMGCPVIGSNRGALPEIIEKTGLLVNTTDTKELANAMEKMTKSSIRLEYIKKGKVNSEKYSWKTFAKQVQSALSNV